MMYNFLFLFVFPLFLQQGNGLDINESLLQLEQTVNAASINISSIADRINNARDRHNKMVEGKLSCLSVQYSKQRNALNSTIVETTLKALSKDKRFPSFQCISTAGNEYLNALTATLSKTPGESDRIKEKGVEYVKPYGLLIPGFYSYLNNSYSEYARALRECESESDLSKVLGEASKRIENLNVILEQIEKKLEDLSFVFFNEYINFVHVIDESFRKSYNDGKSKVTACLRK